MVLLSLTGCLLLVEPPPFGDVVDTFADTDSDDIDTDDTDTEPPPYYIDVALTGEATCYVDGDGELSCEGDGGGWNPPNLSDVVEIDGGDGWLWSSMCALRQSGAVSCWGQEFDQAGNSPPTGSYGEVEVGEGRACGLTTAGDLRCWGLDSGFFDAPVGTSFEHIGGGAGDWCGVRSDGTGQCWGGGGMTFTADPGIIDDLAVGAATMCALAGGIIQCLGDTGGLRVGAPTDYGWTEVDAWGGVACARKPNGIATCWGSAWQGTVPDELFQSIAVHQDGVCGATNSGRALCWDR